MEEELGPDHADLWRRVEDDLRRHEATLNEHARTTLTIRGFAFTAAAALIASGFASNLALPEYFAMVAVFGFLFADYYFSCLYSDIRKTVPVLESLSVSHRQLLRKHRRSQRQIARFTGNLRAYATRGAVPPDKPRLRPLRQAGRLGVFLPLYGALFLAAVISAVYIETAEGANQRECLVAARSVSCGLPSCCKVVDSATAGRAAFRRASNGVMRFPSSPAQVPTPAQPTGGGTP